MRIHVLAAAALLTASFSLQAATDDPFVVHEWGTFTTAQGADGEQIGGRRLPAWTCPSSSIAAPATRAASGTPTRAFQGKDVTALVRMETPVIYFYSQRERVADVRVLFRGGNVTEWYPQATQCPNRSRRVRSLRRTQRAQFVIDWNRRDASCRAIRSEMTVDRLIRGKEPARGDHYYAARETDANFLRMSSPQARKAVEHERDLFYRGVGYFKAPLSVGMDADEQRCRSPRARRSRSCGVFVVPVRNGNDALSEGRVPPSRARPRSIDVSTQPFGALRDVREAAMQDMAAALVEQGLYEKEAQAMVNTWQDQWFAEEGTRVLYLLPRAWTDRTLPLQVAPRPDSVVRVMVGRAELITPSDERELREQALTFSRGDAKTKAAGRCERPRAGTGKVPERGDLGEVGATTDRCPVKGDRGS